MSEGPVSFALDGSIARLTLNRPEFGNAIDLAMARALLMTAIRCDTDPAIRCVVLTGEGRLFCAGGDIRLIASAGEYAAALLSELAGTLHMAISRLARMRKPLLTLINGPAAGAGLSLAIFGDIVLAARSAHFTTAYSMLGLTPDGGMSWLLPRFVGLRKAQEMILTNRRIVAAEAEEIGLITRMVEDSEIVEEGAAVATSLSQSATAALGATRSLLLGSFAAEFETQLDKETRAITAAAARVESREGIAAFLSKRKPNFGETDSDGDGQRS
jgi:2-(1,2-epoxy-1,2-dihydrophenyl)acetyl-CoA isomerase